MKILGLDTTTFTTALALCDHGQPLVQLVLASAQLRSERLLPAISSLLELARCDFQEIDIFAVASGPGSFTGVRVGMSVAKGFAAAGNKTIAVISSLKSLAANVCFGLPQQGFDYLVAVVVDARCQQVYTGIWQFVAGQMRELRPEACEGLDAFVADLASLQAQMSLPVLLLGDGAQNCVAQLPSGFLLPSGGVLATPNAVAICRLAEDKKSWRRASDAQPNYLFNL
ncbi:MAG: tRNA (adenosine(37)-N6)-threonylcarbamoyltransferase complex dimerization subunit type 1 TsaB [Oscillospiraceae bacterium]|nr:tRNA (adenosine(37)-N6)-threonylcarbamoyltransferase complex dimerization subunit type 1 TsaB [Oscillospiraceae bacterium]